ncbi:MAG: fructose-bisphosphatase class III, partial [Paludibacteraceae bacterium]|nr:fructose-bisphosphatase class III [Paludibacteraceae bacterium]
MTERYLRLLGEKFPNAQSVVTELINLQAILSLPKGTEHFMSDLHGASSAFIHMIKNASGVVRKKVDEVYGEKVSEEEKRAICALIYYPEERIELIKQFYAGEEVDGLFKINSQLSNLPDLDKWYHTRLHQVVNIARAVTIKYSRSKVRKLLPPEYAYIIGELLYESNIEQNERQTYYNAVIDSLIEIGSAEQLIIAICNLIHSLTIDTLHIVGDIFDRGPGSSKILDELANIRDYDIQWGNHDIEWMGAMAGNQALIATVLRVSIRYANIETLEEDYGINLLPLASFAMTVYGDDPCTIWQTKDFENNPRLTRSAQLMAKMHKAISIIQFKLEGQTVRRHPEWNMDHRAVLDKLDQCELLDSNLPTIDRNDPYALSREEAELMSQLARSFHKSEKM